MSVDININVSVISPEHLTATWDTVSRPDDPGEPAGHDDQTGIAPEMRVLPIGTSVLAPGLVTPFGV